MHIQDIVHQLEDGERRLRAFAQVSAEALRRSYAPGKWNGFQVISHVADTDVVLYYRFLKAAAEEGSPIVPFDQDRWVAELDCAERPVPVSLAAVAAVRLGLVHHLSTLPIETLQRRAVHPERGEMTPLSIAEFAGTHALHHLEQLEAIRDGKTWAPKPK